MAATLAANHLFEINENSPKINEEDKQEFYTIVEISLFVCMRNRLNIQLDTFY